MRGERDDERLRSELGVSPRETEFEPWLREAARAPVIPRSEVERNVAVAGAPGVIAIGDVLGNRFRVEERVGSGGMGEIFRGTDRESLEAVAIKVLASRQFGDANRFAHEARVLAGFSHPAIVRYIAHGTTSEAAQYLVMEWLHGEDLAARLARAPLTVDESLLVLRRACQGLAQAHARGVVHRDLKPSNLFLVNREPSSLKLLDFGIARDLAGMRTITQSGAVLGTVGYMSPEQAMMPRQVDSRTDVFALGCVLFECLTGRAAFVGSNAVAVLAKVLRSDPPRVRELRPELEEPLDALVGRMLAKNSEERPNDAAAILSALDELEHADRSVRSVSLAGPLLGLTTAEQKIVSVLLGKRASAPAETLEELDSEIRRIESLTREFGTEPLALRGGGLLVVLSGQGAGTDASQAARCALSLARERPDLCLAVATGRVETTGRVPMGAAIDRAAELLDRFDDPRAGVAIDDVTAGLLDPTFEIRRDGTRLSLIGERADLEATRPLMGRRTSFVGRDKDLGLLELTLRECIDESLARAVLITGPPGHGKSRLRHEFVSKLRARGDAKVLLARADPVGAGSAFLLVRQLVCQAIGVSGGELTVHHHAKLRAHVGRVCSPTEAPWVTDFLTEMLGGSSQAPACPELLAARNDPQIMSRWLSRSFHAWVAGVCRQTPLLIVLEDLQWGDQPSLTYLGEVLRALSSQPLMILALARPEVSELFPNLWAGTETQRLALGRLTPRAAEHLVREALGEQVSGHAVTRIVERADGNAFYLEELIRRAADGDIENVPETVLALVQSRLARLDPEARRIIRAASIFGDVFWASGVCSVLGATPPMFELADWLRVLIEHEVLSPSYESRFAGELQYQFRHGILRDAAYAMLTDADRTNGHCVVGEWLERAGEQDALRLAEHFQHGGQPSRAIPNLVEAAHAALDGRSIGDAIALVGRAIASGAQGLELGRLRLIQAQAVGMSGDWPECVAVSRIAMTLLPVGSTEWFRSVAMLLWSGAFVSNANLTPAELSAVLNVRLQPEQSGPYGLATFFAIEGLTRTGQLDLARAILERANTAGDVAADPVFAMWIGCARARLLLVDGDLGQALASLFEARTLAERTGAGFGHAMTGFYCVSALSETGHVERAAGAAREMLVASEPLGMRAAIDWTTFCLAWTRIVAGEPADAIAPLRSLFDRADSVLDAAVRAALSQALLLCGDTEEAEREAVSSQQGTSSTFAEAVGMRSRALLELHFERYETALACAETGLQAAERGSYLLTVSILSLVRAEALHGLGRIDAAHVAIRDARSRIFKIAATLDDLELRDAYLTRVRAHSRTLELAAQWLGSSG